MTCLLAALDYLHKGLAAIPLRPGDKQPIFKGWQTNPLKEAQLQLRWKMCPEANVGVVMGLSNLIGLDLDNKEGEALLIEWAGGAPPTTWSFNTPSGGYRLLYKLPDGYDSNARSYKDTTGGEALRILMGASQTVMPPSTFEGIEYTWCEECSPNEIELAPCPEWLLKRLTGEKESPKVSNEGNDGLGTGAKEYHFAPQRESEQDRLLKRASAYLATMEPAIAGQGGHNATYRAACKLVGQFGLSENEALDLLMSEYNLRCVPEWKREEMLHKVQSALASHKEDGHMAREEKPAKTRSVPPLKEKKEPAKMLEMQADVCYNTEFPPVRWAVEGIFPEGVALLAGRPKAGKSWFMLQTVQAVAGGWPLLGISTTAGDVLYLALEDSYRRLQKRMKKMLGECPPPNRLTLSCMCPRNGEGGLAAIEEWLNRHPDARLVAIDTFAKFRDSRKGDDVYAQDYEAIAGLQSMAIRRKIAVVLVTHTRKPKGEAEDPLDEVQSSSGITGAADAVLVLRRQRFTNVAQLFVTGRDLEERDVDMQWRTETGVWIAAPKSQKNGLPLERQHILDLLETNEGPMGILAMSVATPHMTYQAVQSLVQRMYQDGQISRPERGLYALPTQTPNSPDSPEATQGESP